jgi:hypothetical protein
MSRYRIPIAVAVVVLLVLLFLALRPSDDNSTGPTTTATTRTTPTAVATEPAPTPTPTPKGLVATIVVRGGKPVGGIRRLKATKGAKVVLMVSSDVSDHVHVHGFDLMRDVAPGNRARIPFTADLVGRFEIELEDRGVQIAELTVEP